MLLVLRSPIRLTIQKPISLFLMVTVVPLQLPFLRNSPVKFGLIQLKLLVMVIEFSDFSRVHFITVDGFEYDVLPLPNSRLAIPKDIDYLKISLFPKNKKD